MLRPWRSSRFWLRVSPLLFSQGVLKARGHDVGLIHVCDNLWELPTTDQVLDRIEEFRPDIVGFSAMSQQYAWCCEVSKALRARRPDLPQAVGGVHCTMVPDDVTADELWDWVFVGECDLALAGGVQGVHAVPQESTDVLDAQVSPQR